ncbi:unnamed protein product [Parascedosporium putredinis]|uniref:Enoyl-CoA hydratase n=1 Tax=Parascedosporium putredinis TaxID=1442378 RepID=A0A9P1H1S0_9PEZI|nr:unnamed protein product [Parascedosporium putredinis]CAI7994026.1 unnamed protein product [Parascedosporium putredinis]
MPLSPPPVVDTLVSFPAPHVLLVTLNRPKQLNAIHTQQHHDLARLFEWFDVEPTLRCAVITGNGRAFCAGADLGEWNKRTNGPAANAAPRPLHMGAGFGGLSNRGGKKPVIAAVNGLCLGGGMEMVVNCDMIVAGTKGVKFGTPEVKRGVVALAGALPRLVRTLGKQRASEMTLLGRMYGSEEMQKWGIVNFIVESGEGKEGAVVAEAVKIAVELAANSPDSVITSREGLALGWEPLGPITSTEVLGRGMYGRMDGAANMKEGLASFVEKREPKWTDSKL